MARGGSHLMLRIIGLYLLLLGEFLVFYHSKSFYSLLLDCIDAADSDVNFSIHCLNQTNNEAFGHDDKSICMLTRITPSIYRYAVYTYFIQSWYASLQGYRMLPLLPDSSAPDYQYHRKLQPLLESMNLHRSKCKQFIWFDADLIPVSSGNALHEKFSIYPESHIVVSKDVSTIINTGCMLLRNTKWTRQFLQTWIDCRQDPRAHNEQLGFHCAFLRYSTDKMSEKVKILAEYELNSIAPAMQHQLPSHTILHLAAEDNELRYQVFKHAASNIMTYLREEQSNSLPQLGVTREMLQEISISTYKRIYEEIERNISLHHTQKPSHGIISIDLLGRYRMAVSKYCYAQEYFHKDRHLLQDYVAMIHIRSRAYEFFRQLVCRSILLVIESDSREIVYSTHDEELTEIVFNNLLRDPSDAVEVSRALLQSNRDDWTGRIMSMLPEIMKLCAELGYELLGKYLEYDGQSSAYAVSVLAEEIRTILNLLINIVHSSQQTMIEKMIGEFQLFIVQHEMLNM